MNDHTDDHTGGGGMATATAVRAEMLTPDDLAWRADCQRRAMRHRCAAVQLRIAARTMRGGAIRFGLAADAHDVCAKRWEAAAQQTAVDFILDDEGDDQ